MPKERRQSQEILSSTDVFDKMEELLEKKFPELQGFEMPYCSLVTDSETKERTYRVQLNIHTDKSIFSKTAIAEVNAENGAITMFKEGYIWPLWI